MLFFTIFNDKWSRILRFAVAVVNSSVCVLIKYSLNSTQVLLLYKFVKSALGVIFFLCELYPLSHKNWTLIIMTKCRCCHKILCLLQKPVPNCPLGKWNRSHGLVGSSGLSYQWWAGCYIRYPVVKNDNRQNGVCEIEFWNSTYLLLCNYVLRLEVGDENGD